MSKKFTIAGFLAFTIGALATAGINPFAFISRMSHGALYVWGSDEVVGATQLNGNFTELNTTKVGGGVTLTNSDVASNAAIAHSKLATPALVPKAWAIVTSNCTGSAAAGTACTVGDSSGITSITTNGVSGEFRVNLSYTPANSNFSPQVTSHTTTSVCMALTRSTSAPHVQINCYDYAGAANDVNQFSVLVMDS